MNLSINPTPTFAKFAKRLAKKYTKLVFDLKILGQVLQKDLNNSINLGDDFYKIRLQNSSNSTGKSSGFRVVYFFKTQTNEIYLLDIFSKNEVANIKKHTLIQILKKYEVINNT